MDIHNEFIAQEKALVFYAGKAIINKRHAFFDRYGNPWSLAAASGFTFKIWEEREGGRLMIDWYSPVNIEASSALTNEFLLNAPEVDTLIERGKYYYEIDGIFGGYPVLLAYSLATFL